MWAVIDPVMRAVITETQSFSAVEMRASSLTFWHYIIVLSDTNLLDAGLNSAKRGHIAPRLGTA